MLNHGCWQASNFDDLGDAQEAAAVWDDAACRAEERDAQLASG
jgi:hypothetical protein